MGDEHRARAKKNISRHPPFPNASRKSRKTVKKQRFAGTLRTQCKPQQHSLILQELGSFLSCCRVLSPLMWSSHSKAVRSKAVTRPGHDQWQSLESQGSGSNASRAARFSSTRSGLPQERDKEFPLLLPRLPVRSRNFSWKRNRCRALHPSQIHPSPAAAALVLPPRSSMVCSSLGRSGHGVNPA